MGEVEFAGWLGRLNAAVTALSWAWTAAVVVGAALVAIRYFRRRTVGLGFLAAGIGAQALGAVLTDVFGRVSSQLGPGDDAEVVLGRMAAGAAVVFCSLALNLLGTVLVVTGALTVGAQPRGGAMGR